MQTRDSKIYRVTLTGSIVNMVLLILKFVAGILGNSAAYGIKNAPTTIVDAILCF